MKEILAVIGLAAVFVLAGRIWIRFPLPAARTAAWLALLASVALTATVPWSPIARMVALCGVLLAAMKSLVYVEWASRPPGRRLGWGPFLAFAFLWFGMDPGAFSRRPARLEWRAHLVTGLVCVVTGTLLALLVRSSGWTTLVLVFVPMSIGFHYGALGLLTAAWRRFGYPVRTLFRNPLRSTGLADFWATRWNLGYSQMMARVVMRPAEARLGSRGATLAVFGVSGLLHEIAITLPVGAGFGLPTLYFLLQGAAVQVEPLLPAGRVKRAWAVLLVVAPLGLLFPPAFREEVILPCLRILPDLTAFVSG